MSNEVAEFFGGGSVADRVQKAKQLRNSRHSVAAKRGSEFPFLGCKNGELQFTYGQDNAAVPEGTYFAVNIGTAKSGWAYWYKRKKTEELTSIWEESPIDLDELPDISDLRDNQGNRIEWGPCYSWHLSAVNGPMRNTTVSYGGTSNYMLVISEDLIAVAANRMEESEDCFPVIRLYNEPYPNPDNGNPTSKHKFELVGWASPQGEVVEKLDNWVEIDKAPAKKAPAKRTRRRAS